MKRITLFLSLFLLLFSAACTVMTELPSTEVVPTAGVAVPTQAAPVETEAPSPTEEPTEEPAAQPTAEATEEVVVVVPAPVLTEDVAPTQAGPMKPEDFDTALIQAIEAKDFGKLRGMMGSSFTLAGWRSEGRFLTPEVALSELSQTALGSGATPAASTGVDPSELLEGANPLNFFPPDAVRAVYFDFVGANGTDQALAIIGSDPTTGSRYWKGILVAMGGFHQDQPDLSDLNQFSQALGNAALSKDFNTLHSMMGSQFAFATLDPATRNGSLNFITSQEAVHELRWDELAQGADPVILWNTDIPALIGGSDPLDQWGPNANAVRAIHFTSLGTFNTAEAVFVIGREPSGRLYWLGILQPLNAETFQQPSPEPVGDALPTSVKWVEALEALNVRSGPGLNYAVEGKVRQGEIAQVSGVSPDGDWWQIYCTQDASGRCWISADASLSRPTSAP